jgi:hypothetical protein
MIVIVKLIKRKQHVDVISQFKIKEHLNENSIKKETFFGGDDNNDSYLFY